MYSEFRNSLRSCSRSWSSALCLSSNMTSRRNSTLNSSGVFLIFSRFSFNSWMKVLFCTRCRGWEASFTGTITKIGSDFVELTVRGNMFMDNIVDTRTEVRDVAANCDGGLGGWNVRLTSVGGDCLKRPVPKSMKNIVLNSRDNRTRVQLI